jgi:hypothetical protein
MQEGLGVVIDELRVEALCFAELAARVEGIYAKGALNGAVEADAGNPVVAGAIDDFTRRWAYGLRCLHTDVVVLGRALGAAAAAYQHVEDDIIKAAR